MNPTVLIDGIEYVPVDKINAQIKKIEQVLKAQKYLSSTAIDEILKAFENEKHLVEKPKGMKYPNKWSLPFKYNTTHKSLFRISGVLSNGSILYKRRKSPARWNIQQAMKIRKGMRNDTSKGMTYRDVKEIGDDVNLSSNLVRKIMYNIEHGDLIKYIEEWSLKFNQKELHQKPIQNNPQKRREMGDLYV